MNKIISKINKSTEIINQMVDIINNSAAEIDYDSFNSSETLLVIVDMVKGFAVEGALSSERINKLIEPVLKIFKEAKQRGYKIIAFRDKHTVDSVELLFRVEHCTTNFESDLIDGLENIDICFDKNSTNGFITEEHLNWMKLNGEKYKNIIIVGDCTDICISQYALTLKAYFNERNIDNRIIIPIDNIDTYDYGVHNGDLLNIFSLYQFIDNGIEVVKTILSEDNNDKN